MPPSANGSLPRVAVLIATRDRPAALRRCLDSLGMQALLPHEVLVLDNAGTPPIDKPAATDVPGLALRTLRVDAPLGVAAARQHLLDATTADVALLLDDDAWLTAPDVLGGLARRFAADASLAAVALPILDHRHAPPRWLTPFGSRADMPGGTDVPAAYFVGGAHALRVAAAQAVGGYDASFVYGEEELDLSYRLVGAGHALAYAPALTVEHWPDGDVPATFQPGRLAHRVRNRIVLAWQHLPAPMAAAFTAAWLAYHAAEALRHRAVPAFLRGVRQGLRDARARPRRPLGGGAVAYLRAHGGRLWR